MKPHANEVRSKFLEGMDTSQIAKLFGISEGEAYGLLHECRRTKMTRPARYAPSLERRTVIRSPVIIEAAARACNVQPNDLLRNDRYSEYVRSRRVAYELFREFRPDMNLTAVGRALRKHHATVINAFNQTALDGEAHATARDRLCALAPETNPGAFVVIAVSKIAKNYRSGSAVNSKASAA